MIPVPRHVEHLPGRASFDVRSVRLDPALPVQGYELLVGEEGAEIRHRDELGRRYALQALERLGEEREPRAARIVDHPDFEHRGLMLDISRDRVPTRSTLAWLVDVLASIRINHLELYIEHTFAYAGHELVWGGASALTGEDVRWLDGRCAERGIELAANQNTFGHMERWLRHDEHRWRAECPAGAISPFGGRPMAPATLAPTPANAELALGLVRELAAHHRSQVVHIGADEPFELGQGASAAEVARRGRAAVYLEHLDRLLRPLIAEGRQVLFWGDVLRRHPDLVARLPRDGATAVVWHYDAPSDDAGVLGALGAELLETLGLPDDFQRGFDAHVRGFADVGHPFWVAPGTSSWNSLVGRWPNARANVLDAARTGVTAGATGFLLTDWGDNGHLQPLTVSLLPLVHAAGVAWCGATNADADPAPVVDRLTGIEGLGARLAALGGLAERAGVGTVNGSPLFAALDPARPLPLIGAGHPDGHAATMAALEEALAWLRALPPSAHRDGMVAATRLARHGAWRLARRDRLAVPDPASLAEDITECRALQRAAWLATSRPGGLDDSLAHLPTY